MTLGAGILWSTVLILTAAAVYQISVRKRWKTVGKAFGILILIGALIGGGVWGWIEYQDRPYVVEELGNVRLGMTPLEVKLAKGKPTTERNATEQEDSDKFKTNWIYGSGDTYLWIVFYGKDPNGLKASIICKKGGYGKLLGLGKYNSEKDVVEKLGEPDHESISSDGLSKAISYTQWKVAYEITKGDISQLCITETGSISYPEEYAVVDIDDLPE